MDTNTGNNMLLSWPGLLIQQCSVTVHKGITYALVTTEQGQRRLVVYTSSEKPLLEGFEGSAFEQSEGTLWLGPLSARNATWLRERLDWLCPRPQGLQIGVGLGDRLGLATPGHLRAVRAAG